jgi:hypothetical protein
MSRRGGNLVSGIAQDILNTINIKNPHIFPGLNVSDLPFSATIPYRITINDTMFIPCLSGCHR